MGGLAGAAHAPRSAAKETPGAAPRAGERAKNQRPSVALARQPAQQGERQQRKARRDQKRRA